MPKRNYGYEKRQKELNRLRKREEKRQRKLDRKAAAERSPDHLTAVEDTAPEE